MFKKRALPLTLYVPTDYPDGTGELWWIALAEIVSRASEIELCRNGALWGLPAETVPEKYRAYDEIYWWLRLIDEATHALYLSGAPFALWNRFQQVSAA